MVNMFKEQLRHVPQKKRFIVLYFSVIDLSQGLAMLLLKLHVVMSYPEVNVMMGKAGYFKRKQAQTKTVSKIATIHDGEVTIDDNAANNMFQMASASTQPVMNDGIDIMELPFFNIGRRPTQAAITFTPQGAAVTNKRPLELEGQKPDSESKEPTAPDDDESDQDDVAITSILPDSFASTLNIAKPKAKAKAASAKHAASKQAAKPTSKGKEKVKAEGSSGQSAKKRKDKEQDSTRLIKLDLPPSKAAKTSDIEATDKQLIKEWNETMEEHRTQLFVCESDTDPAIAECLKGALKALTATASSIKQKKKSLARRQGDADFVLSELDEMLNEVMDAQKMATALLQCSGEDTSLVTSMEDMNAWKFSQPLQKRALKCACISNLKFQDWKSFTECTKTKIASSLGPEDGEAFFWMMVNEFVQKLLRAISTKSVSFQRFDVV